ncbi:PstS family phosphate ABC transporter substrate-binding protein [Magnetovibrio blakemorei]|uniref:Phosphate ABC transporter substrate-binding protein n=1 Tax=Magnetovibrio blakemorei TaxID=28181 RepID=A0A1E5Q891_9PROT|nr:PstS family phosphate ABC transporter substrate-binding protein [Magnetovibrio blakemorei]OEJ67577.1 phosphate ABC transporter substrate-binding protein [Magnetovibrio blakemorei]
MFKKTLTVAALAGIVVAGGAAAADMSRDQIRIVGSSTVFPFSTVVAEQFGKTSSFKTPVVESTGSGGGLKLFCSGVGDEHPDITNASRRIKKSEVEKCASNGVTSITEVKIGYDGIVFANANAAPAVNLTRKEIWLALAKDVPAGEGKTQPNPYKTWKDVRSDLPAVKIEVMGPPPTSGTRDAFVELVMDEGCESYPWIKAMKKTDKKAFKALCQSIREDGGYVEAGENDNLIVQKLDANKDAFGIFGYSFLDQNADKIKGNKVEGVEPTFENIASGAYSVSRPLFFYVKNAHAGKVPGIKEYVAEFASEKAWGTEGYLADKGLIPMPKEERAKFAHDATALANLSM